MSRPPSFTGFSGVVSGALTTSLTATDWNAFTNRIIQFALYKIKGNDIGTFTFVSAGDDQDASIFNQAVAGLNVLSTFITQPIPSTKSSMADIYASYIIALKTALNSIT